MDDQEHEDDSSESEGPMTFTVKEHTFVVE